MRSLGVERHSIELNALNSLDFSGGHGFESLPAIQVQRLARAYLISECPTWSLKNHYPVGEARRLLNLIGPEQKAAVEKTINELRAANNGGRAPCGEYQNVTFGC